MYGGESYEGDQEKGKKTKNKQSKAYRNWFFSFSDNIDFFSEGSWTKYYTSIQIEKGTSLWEIAEDYITEEYASEQEYIEEVMRMNHLNNDVIYEGAYLCVPYYSSEQ